MARAINTSVLGALSPNFDKGHIKRVDLDLSSLKQEHKLAFLLDNVFTPEECQRLIDLSEAEGYKPALVHRSDGSGVLRPGFRDSHRIMIDDKEFVKVLFARIHNFLPSTFQNRKLVEINERLRFLRYYKGDQFKAHEDGSYGRADGSAETLITLQIYLNEGFEGGETTFLNYYSEIKRCPVIPKVGRILVFQHNILHEGSLVKSGQKYSIRTDVLYS